MRESAGVAVTRASEDAAPLASALESVGLRPVLTPLLYFAPLDTGALAERLNGAEPYAWMACTSRHGVEALGAAMSQRGVSPCALGVHRIAAVGAGTAAALESLGLHVDLVPEQSDAEHLARALLARGDAPGHVAPRLLFPRAQEARDTMPSLLREAGWIVDDIACYETCTSVDGGARLEEGLRTGEVRAVTLASGSAARAVAALVSGARLAAVPLVSIGPTTTAAALAAGLSIAAEAPTVTMDALADATRRILLGTLTHA